MAKRNPIGFSKRTFSFTGKIHAKSEILTALESDPVLRKEIARTFQQANRRIQNVENSGIVSPAVVALNKGDVKGFAKFSMKHDWNNNLKGDEYCDLDLLNTFGYEVEIVKIANKNNDMFDFLLGNTKK